MSMFMRGDKSSENPAAQAMPPETAKAPTLGEAQRPAPARGDTVPSLISAGLRVKGNLESAGEIQIDGNVEGDVKGKAVTVGEGAAVKGSILGDSAIVAGTIEGRIEAMTVRIQSTARLTGDIIHQDLKIDSGAYVDGHCSPQLGKGESRPETAKPADSAPEPGRRGADKPEEAPGKVH